MPISKAYFFNRQVISCCICNEKHVVATLEFDNLCCELLHMKRNKTFAEEQYAVGICKLMPGLEGFNEKLSHF